MGCTDMGNEYEVIRRREVGHQYQALKAQVERLRAFAEEMAWYAPQEDWEDAARRLLRYGDCRSYVEIVPEPGTDR